MNCTPAQASFFAGDISREITIIERQIVVLKDRAEVLRTQRRKNNIIKLFGQEPQVGMMVEYNLKNHSTDWKLVRTRDEIVKIDYVNAAGCTIFLKSNHYHSIFSYSNAKAARMKIIA